MTPGTRVALTRNIGFHAAGATGIILDPAQHPNYTLNGYDLIVDFDDGAHLCVMAYEVQTVPKPVTDEQVIA